MARLTEHGLRRSVGVPGLFATAYGNVGSSVYYALALLAALNVRGLGESAKLNLVLAVADLCTPVLLVGLGIVLVLNPSLLVNQVHLGTAPSWHNLIFALSVAMVAYTGIETVSNMAEEAKDPGHDVPKAVNLVVIAVLAVY